MWLKIEYLFVISIFADTLSVRSFREYVWNGGQIKTVCEGCGQSGKQRHINWWLQTCFAKQWCTDSRLLIPNLKGLDYKWVIPDHSAFMHVE